MFAVQGCSIAAAPLNPPHPPTHTLLQPISVNQGLFGGGEGKSLLSGCRPHAMTLSKQSQLSAAGRGTVPCRPASLSTLGCLGETVIILADGSLKKNALYLKKKKNRDTKRDKSSLLFLKMDGSWNIFNLSWSWAVKHSQLLNDVLLNFDIDYSVFVFNAH